jgi:hypothetical protein
VTFEEDLMPASLETLLDFGAELERRKIWYSMSVSRPLAIKVTIDVPGELIEIEFMIDGEIEVERFRSDGHIETYDSTSDLLPLLDMFE